MAQINLLKQTTSKTTMALPKVLVWLIALILICLVGYYGYLSVAAEKIKGETSDIQLKINTDKQAALAVAQRPEILTRQLQLKTLNDLISKHIYWSKLFSPLASVTLNTVTYSSLRLNNDNSITLSGTVPTLQDLDLYLQVFDLPDVYKYFNHVKISSFNKVEDKNTTAIKFEVDIQYDPSIVQYSDSSKTASK